MREKIKDLISEISRVTAATNDELESFRLRYLSKKGLLSDLFDEFRNVANEEKKEVGQLLNQLKQLAQDRYNNLKSLVSSVEDGNKTNDLTRPAFPFNTGSRHPISIVRNEIIGIFSRIGFVVSEGPEIEDDDPRFHKTEFRPGASRPRHAGYFLHFQDISGGFQQWRHSSSHAHFACPGKGYGEPAASNTHHFPRKSLPQ
jgi:phenylalanyl-tRNA synthetase alpha subunit